MAGLLLQDGVLRVGSRAIFEGVSPRFELETVRDDRVRSECTGELVRDLDPVHVGVLSLGENAVGPSGAHRADPISRHVVQIASRLPTTSRFMANARCKLWWMTPTWGASECDSIPPETQFLLLEMGGGEGETSVEPSSEEEGTTCRSLVRRRFPAHLRGRPPRATLSGHALDAKTAIEQRRGATETSDGVFTGKTSERPLCLVAESNDVATTSAAPMLRGVQAPSAALSPFEAAEAVVAAASARMRTFGLRVNKRTPPTAEVFGWCTWDAFYHSRHSRGGGSRRGESGRRGTPARVRHRGRRVAISHARRGVPQEGGPHLRPPLRGRPSRKKDEKRRTNRTRDRDRTSRALSSEKNFRDAEQSPDVSERWSRRSYGGRKRRTHLRTKCVSGCAGERVARAVVALVPRARREGSRTTRPRRARLLERPRAWRASRGPPRRRIRFGAFRHFRAPSRVCGRAYRTWRRPRCTAATTASRTRWPPRWSPRRPPRSRRTYPSRASQRERGGRCARRRRRPQGWLPV